MFKSWKAACGWVALALLGVPPACAQGLPASEFPAARAAETRRLEFHAATVSATGTVEEQARIALRELQAKGAGAPIVKLRAFAMTVEDLAAVARTVREAFGSEPLPVLSLLRVAALPAAGQRVAMESTSIAALTRNPHGLAFLAGLASPAGERTIDGLARVAREAGVAAGDVLRLTCFAEAEGLDVAARRALAATFPSAEATFVQSLAREREAVIECEGVARLAAPAVPPVSYFNFADAPPSPYFSRAALCSTPAVVFTDVRMAKGGTPAQVSAAFEELKLATERLGGRLTDVVMAGHYWQTPAVRELERAARRAYLGGTVPAASGLFVTGFADAQAPAAIEWVIALR